MGIFASKPSPTPVPARAGTIKVPFQSNLQAQRELAQRVIGNNANKFRARTSNAAASVYEQLQGMTSLLVQERKQDRNTVLTYDLGRVRLPSEQKQFHRAINDLVALQLNDPNTNIRLQGRRGQKFNILVTNKLHTRQKTEAKPPVTSIFAMRQTDSARIRNVKVALNAAVQNKLRGFSEEKRRDVLKQLKNTLAPDMAVDYIAARIELSRRAA